MNIFFINIDWNLELYFGLVFEIFLGVDMGCEIFLRLERSIVRDVFIFSFGENYYYIFSIFFFI